MFSTKSSTTSPVHSFNYFNLVLTCLFLLSFNAISAQEISNRIILGFQPKVSNARLQEIRKELEKLDLIPYKTYDQWNLEIWEVPMLKQGPYLHAGDMKTWREKTESYPEILWTLPDYKVYANQSPNDSLLQSQWGLTGLNASGHIHALEAWDKETGSKDVVIGIVDTGVDWDHPDLADNIWQNLGEDIDGDGQVLIWQNGQYVFDPDDENGIDDDGNGYADDFIGWDFANNDNNPDDEHNPGHGTHVAGIAGAVGNNQTGISGVAWNSSIMPLRFLDESGSGNLTDALEAFHYASLTKPNILNNSWGTPSFEFEIFELLIESIYMPDQFFVTAAGNNYGNNNDHNPVFPSSFAQFMYNYVSVIASDQNDQISDFSNYGHYSTDLAAPGSSILSTTADGNYGYMSGTSMAAPMVSGAAALILSKYPNLSTIQLKQVLNQSVDIQTQFIGKTYSGGRLNIAKALGLADKLLNCGFNLDLVSYQPVVCGEDSVDFYDYYNEADSYQWMVDGNILQDTSNHITHHFSAKGFHTIQMIAKKDSCSISFNTFVEVINEPALDLEDVEICANSVMLEIEEIDDFIPYGFMWTDSAGNYLGYTPDLSIDTSGVYILSAFDVCKNEHIDTITVSLTGNCVWPGDANADGRVNMEDFLVWGIGNGSTGPMRDDVSSEYRSYPEGPDWDSTFTVSHELASNINFKHIDCNGDGTVDAQDLATIKMHANFNDNSWVPGDNVSAQAPTLILNSGSDTTFVGDTVSFTLSLAQSDSSLIDDIYGLTFEVQASGPFETDPDLEVEADWLGTEGVNLEVITVPVTSEDLTSSTTRQGVEVGMTRTNQSGVSGEGEVASFDIIIIIVDDFGGDYSSGLASSLNQSATVSVQDAHLVKSDGSLIALNTPQSQSTFELTILPERLDESKEISTGNWYPNPAQDQAAMPVWAKEEASSVVRFYNMMGQQVKEEIIFLEEGQNTLSISLSDLPNGLYYGTLTQEDKTIYTPALSVQRQ